ncbi:MAG: hypothetical protein ACM65K_24230 [Microcoleus sp.]
METASIIAKNKGRNDIAEKLSAVAEELKKNESVKTPSIPTNRDYSPEGKPDNSTPSNPGVSDQDKPDSSTPSNPGVSDQDRKFLVSVQNQLDENGFLWETWNTLDWKEKVKIGRSACKTMGDPLAAVDILLSSYGDSIKPTPKHFSMRLAASRILRVGARIYCPEVWVEGQRTLKRNAQQQLDSQEEALQKSANDLMPKTLDFSK